MFWGLKEIKLEKQAQKPRLSTNGHVSFTFRNVKSISIFNGTGYINRIKQEKGKAAESQNPVSNELWADTGDFDDVNYYVRGGRLLKYIQEEQFQNISSLFRGSETEKD